ncbi:hypothetical protein E2C01_064824 [Portunus trituberculatus]|uniref:Uncharacterized protein n=1 Tax=Portunus trituberculatus TaxID=210409 RepID=A0A5B7HH75_PORTR|nr:hypothetical protein [Portunus trituberculatus]
MIIFSRSPLLHFKPLHKSTLSLLCPTQCDYRKLKREAGGNERPLSPGRQHFSAAAAAWWEVGRLGKEEEEHEEEEEVMEEEEDEPAGEVQEAPRVPTAEMPPCLLKLPRDSNKFR